MENAQQLGRKSDVEKVRKGEDAGARKGREVAKHCVFPMFCGSRSSKSRLAKAPGAEPAHQMKDEKLHAVVARTTFGSENVQNASGPISCTVEKVHADVARSTCGSENVQNAPGPEHFWKLRCGKSACKKMQEAHLQVKMYKTRQVRTTFGR